MVIASDRTSNSCANDPTRRNKFKNRHPNVLCSRIGQVSSSQPGLSSARFGENETTRWPNRLSSSLAHWSSGHLVVVPPPIERANHQLQLAYSYTCAIIQLVNVQYRVANQSIDRSQIDSRSWCSFVLGLTSQFVPLPYLCQSCHFRIFSLSLSLSRHNTTDPSESDLSLGPTAVSVYLSSSEQQ